MVSVDGVAPGGDAARDVEPGPPALARERSSDSLDFAPDGSGRPAESSTPGALGRDEDDDLAVAEVVEDLVRERSASARRRRASKSKTGANATPARARANAPPAPRARPRAEPKPRPAVNISPSVFRPPIRVVHASWGEPRDHDDDANDDAHDDPRAAEDGVGIGIGVGNDISVESSPGGAARRRRRALPPSRILDARAIMDACAASRPSECFSANLAGRRLAAVDAEELRYLSSHVSRLRVCDNDLEGEDVAALASLASLRVLDASANAARVIPAETFALRRALEPERADLLAELPAPPPPPPFASLARLDLSFNALDHRCLATLSTLAALERLNLSDNRVDELPTNLFARNDEDARRAFEDGLDADAGAYLDGGFVPFPSLRRLRLSRQTPRLASRRCDWVATLARLPRLARLSLDGNALDGVYVRAGSNPTTRAAFRPGADFPRLAALDLAGNPLRRVDALAALTPLAATTRRRNPTTNATRRRERIRTDGVCEDDSRSDGSDDDSDDDSEIGGRLEEIRIFDTPLGEALALEGDREGLRRAFGLHGDEDTSAFGFGSTRSARARGRAEALASGALIATRRARFGEGDARDAVSAPLAGALVATLEPARGSETDADADAKTLTLDRGTLKGLGRGFVAVRDDARPRKRDDALRFAADDAATDAVTTRLDAFARAANTRDLAASYAIARRNDDAARRRAIREAEKDANEPRAGRVVERVAGARSESSSVAERRAPAPPPSSRDEFEEDERFERFGGDGNDDGYVSRSARLERRLGRGDARDDDDEYDDDEYADESRANGKAGRARAMLELRRALRPRATPREDGNRSLAYARPTAATAAKTKPTARLTLARRRVDAEGGARVRTVEEILRDLG